MDNQFWEFAFLEHFGVGSLNWIYKLIKWNILQRGLKIRLHFHVGLCLPLLWIITVKGGLFTPWNPYRFKKDEPENQLKSTFLQCNLIHDIYLLWGKTSDTLTCTALLNCILCRLESKSQLILELSALICEISFHTPTPRCQIIECTRLFGTYILILGKNGITYNLGQLGFQDKFVQIQSAGKKHQE